MNHSPRDPELIRAAQIIKEGGVIAYPTEAVWGLGCNPFNEKAVLDLLAIKQRDYEKGVILVASSQAQVEFLLEDLSESQRETLNQHWPGPFTFLIPDPHNKVPAWVKGQHSSIAVRVSAHPLVKALCDAYQGPIVSTSCNPQSKPPALNADEVRDYFGDRLGFITSGAIGDNPKPSEIRDLVTGELVRAG